MSENKSLCSFPWIAACVRPSGLVQPCCHWQIIGSDLNIQNSNVSSNPLNSPEWSKIREDMLEGIVIKGCESCYSNELNGNQSGRLASLNWLVPKENKLKPMERIEISFNNLCNLACVGCDDNFSTKWSTENIKAGRPGKKLINNKFNWTEWDLSNLNAIKIIGGEPLMEQDKFCELLETVDLSKISLLVNTNGTILPNERLKSLIEKCKSVNFIVSIDGLAEVNEWIRWPSKFNEVVDVMNTYQVWWRDVEHINLATNSVISIFNIFTIEQFINFMIINFPTWYVNFNWIFHPTWQAIQELPEDVKNKLIIEFTDKNTGELKTYSKDFYKVLIGHLKMPSKINWNIIKNKTFHLAEERNLDFNAMVPSLKNVMDNY